MQKDNVDLVKTFTNNTLKSIVQKISFADIIETTSNSSADSDVSGNVILARKMQRKKLLYLKRETEDQDARNERYCIDGKPFYVKQGEIQQKATAIVDEAIDKELMINQVLGEGEISFREWANEQEQLKKLSKKSIFPPKRKSTDVDAISDHSSRQSSNLNECVVRRRRRIRRKQSNTLSALTGGYMHGPFTKTPKTKKSQSKADRFGIPFTMIDRARKRHEKQKIQENILRRVRLSHMGYRQPPSKDDSSDNESVQNVKRLALLRTPYFLVPTIKISRVRRKERFRNKYLQKERLNRINLLLYERTKKITNEHGDAKDDERSRNIEMDASDLVKKRNFFAKYFQLATKKKEVNVVENQIKEKYSKIIQAKFAEQQRICEPSVNLANLQGILNKLNSSFSGKENYHI